MSSVVISGNTSGAITVAAPAIAGTNTLTLPALTQTVNVMGPAFVAYANASQSITSNTNTKVNINTELVDTANCFDTSLYRFTPNVAGYYLINGMLRCSGTSATTLVCDLWKNNAQYQRGAETSFPSATVTYNLNATWILYLNGTTDYIELYGAIVATSPTFNYTSVANTSYFSGCFLRGS